VRLAPAAPHTPPLPGALGEWSVLRLFRERLDVFGVPRRSFFARLARHAQAPHEAQRLREFGDATSAQQHGPKRWARFVATAGRHQLI